MSYHKVVVVTPGMAQFDCMIRMLYDYIYTLRLSCFEHSVCLCCGSLMTTTLALTTKASHSSINIKYYLLQVTLTFCTNLALKFQLMPAFQYPYFLTYSE